VKMTQLEAARDGIVTPEAMTIAERERIAEEQLRESVARGRVVIPFNPNHSPSRPVGIGEGLSIKVNANLGTSPEVCDLELEIEKLEAAIEAGADTVMDLSTGGDLEKVRREVLSRSAVPVGTVPIYQAGVEVVRRGQSIVDMEAEFLFDVIESHAEDGADFITVHCGMTRKALERLEEQGRVMGVVSRGGAFLSCWMRARGEENPLYEQFPRLLEIARKHDVTLSLGDALRPGCVADATDRAQLEELLTLGELVQAARESGVQVMVEGPGHMPLNQIAANVQIEKSACDGAPFYVLGPLVTDVAPGYDHLVSAIGGAVAGLAGADFLCYVTPAEHLGLPSAADVREGVIAARIAGHAVDICRGVPGAAEWDRRMSVARKRLDWAKQIEMSISPQRASEVLASRSPGLEEGGCTMCGEFCAYRMAPASKAR